MLGWHFGKEQKQEGVLLGNRNFGLSSSKNIYDECSINTSSKCT